MISGLLKVLFGLLLIIGAVYLIVAFPSTWWQAVKDLIQGGIVIGLAMFGALFLLLGLTDMKG